MARIRNALIGLITAGVFIAVGIMAAAAQENEPQEQSTTDASIDYPGFLELASDLEGVRAERLVDLETFNAMAAEDGTIILDTRSADAFQMGHIDGAINLPFSDFTDDKLAKILGDTDTRILIYCNNNFSDNVAPIMLKRVELALNVPTFINLYGYGYENLYELGEYTSINDERVSWVSDLDVLPRLQEN